MSTIQAATRALQECEQRLQKLLGEAATAGDYASVLTLTRWASEVSRLSPGHSEPRVVARDVQTVPQARDPALVRRAPRVMEQRLSTASGTSTYPRFARTDHDLVKVGWSKRARGEYVHRAPREVVGRLAAAATQVGAKGGLVRMEDVLARLKEDGPSVPSYQAYVVIAWLRAEGLVQQHGRQGYTVANGKTLDRTVGERWARLPEE